MACCARPRPRRVAAGAALWWSNRWHQRRHPVAPAVKRRHQQLWLLPHLTVHRQRELQERQQQVV
jgi:hypothetical protein